MSRLDPAPEAICIGPSKTDRACSTHALLVPRTYVPDTGVRLLVFGRSAQSWVAPLHHGDYIQFPSLSPGTFEWCFWLFVTRIALTESA